MTEDQKAILALTKKVAGLEAENADLIHDIERYVQHNSDLLTKNVELKSENQRLREALASVFEYAGYMGDAYLAEKVRQALEINKHVDDQPQE